MQRTSLPTASAGPFQCSEAGQPSLRGLPVLLCSGTPVSLQLCPRRYRPQQCGRPLLWGQAVPACPGAAAIPWPPSLLTALPSSVVRRSVPLLFYGESQSKAIHKRSADGGSRKSNRRETAEFPFPAGSGRKPRSFPWVPRLFSVFGPFGPKTTHHPGFYQGPGRWPLPGHFPPRGPKSGPKGQNADLPGV